MDPESRLHVLYIYPHRQRQAAERRLGRRVVARRALLLEGGFDAEVGVCGELGGRAGRGVDVAGAAERRRACDSLRASVHALIAQFRARS